jgi:NAD-dependent dihydropyrimidine dehydrogenase PreA subunit
MEHEKDRRCELLKTLESFADFAQEEMCGECLPCMLGTEQTIELFKRLTRGEGQERDLELLEVLSIWVKETARCKKGRKAAEVLADSLLKREEYEEHALEKRCPARACSNLVHYRIIPEKCTMCGLCKEVCPQGAIFGEEYIPYLADNEPYYIKISKCDNCGLCLPVCEANAIELI